MLYFIQHGDLLLTQYEYDGGLRPDSKVTAKRRKQIKTGEATIINERAGAGLAESIFRKGRF